MSGLFWVLERIPSTSVTVALIPSPLDRIPSCSFTLKVSICFKDVRLYIFSQQLWRMVQPLSVCMFEMVHTVLLSLVEILKCLPVFFWIYILISLVLKLLYCTRDHIQNFYFYSFNIPCFAVKKINEKITPIRCRLMNQHGRFICTNRTFCLSYRWNSATGITDFEENNGSENS